METHRPQAVGGQRVKGSNLLGAMGLKDSFQQRNANVWGGAREAKGLMVLEGSLGLALGGSGSG